ncbi:MULTISPECIES: type III secretion effector protein [Pseudomonas]|uniref:type III secretion effector protein n=1 Tax=Pseudomonas TaxID=286 RepID=UPI0015E43330|nr:MULTISPECIES: type III secretion effector protein [Pseudomonas]
MSLSTPDTSSAASSALDRFQDSAKAEFKARRPAPGALSFNDANTANVSFSVREDKAGPVFGDLHAPTERHHPAYPGMPARHPGFMDTFRQWMNAHFGWHRPPRPHPCCSNPPPRPQPGYGNPPPRPDPTIGKPYPTLPGRPDPQYSLKNNEQLASQLSKNFDAFMDPKKPGYVSIDSIYAMAKRGWSSDPRVNENIRLAKEMLRRPDLLGALDRHSSTGALDGLIDRQNVNRVIHGDNYFKYNTDKELVGELYEHFSVLKDGPGSADISISDLRNLAREPLTGDSPKDHLVQLAQELLKRSDLVTKLDNLASQNGDGRINLRALLLLLR